MWCGIQSWSCCFCTLWQPESCGDMDLLIVVCCFSVGKLMGAGSRKICLFQRLLLTSGSVASLLLQWSFFSLGVKNCVPSWFNFNLQWEKHWAQAWYPCSHTKTKSIGFFPVAVFGKEFYSVLVKQVHLPFLLPLDSVIFPNTANAWQLVSN